MSGGYAVRNDGQGWRAVDGPGPDPDDPMKVFPDLKTESYSAVLPPDPVALPPTLAEVLAAANERRDRLLSLAAIRIAPLQDAVDLGEETPEDAAQLRLWKQYRVSLNRIDQQVEFPSVIEWPISPEPVNSD